LQHSKINLQKHPLDNIARLIQFFAFLGVSFFFTAIFFFFMGVFGVEVVLKTSWLLVTGPGLLA
jgi:hypothetical protein